MSAALNQPLNFVRNQFHDRLVQVSVYSGLVFYILSNPAVFAFVEKNFPFKIQKDMQLVFHTVLFMLFMYLGTKFFFDPVLGRVMEGYRNKANRAVRKVAPKRK
tara:strand:+ start:608 stop:919 length:312 start_codon:yes stop_codon:yes gene_type:complete